METELYRESALFSWDEVATWTTRSLAAGRTAEPESIASPGGPTASQGATQTALEASSGRVVDAGAVFGAPVRDSEAGFNDEYIEVLIWRLLRHKERDRAGASLWLEIARKRFYGSMQKFPDPGALGNLSTSQATLAQVLHGERWRLLDESVSAVVFGADPSWCYLLVAGTRLVCVRLSALKSAQTEVVAYEYRNGLGVGTALSSERVMRTPGSMRRESVQESHLDTETADMRYFSMETYAPFPSNTVQTLPLPTEVYAIQALEDAPHAFIAFARSGHLFRIEIMQPTGMDVTNVSYTLTTLASPKSFRNFGPAKRILQSLKTPGRLGATAGASTPTRVSPLGVERRTPWLASSRSAGRAFGHVPIVATCVMRGHVLMLDMEGIFRLWDLGNPQVFVESVPWRASLASSGSFGLVPHTHSVEIAAPNGVMASFLAVVSVLDASGLLRLQLIHVVLRRAAEENSTPTGLELTTQLLADAEAPAEELTTCCFWQSQQALCLGWANGSITLIPVSADAISSASTREASGEPWWSFSLKPVYSIAAEDEIDADLHLQGALDRTPGRDPVERILAPHRFPWGTVYRVLQRSLRSEQDAANTSAVTSEYALDQSMSPWTLSASPCLVRYLRERLVELATQDPATMDRFLRRVRMFYLENDASVLQLQPMPLLDAFSLVVHPWGAAVLRLCDASECLFFRSRDHSFSTNQGDALPWMTFLSRLLVERFNASRCDASIGGSTPVLEPLASPPALLQQDDSAALLHHLWDIVTGPCLLTADALQRLQPPPGLLAVVQATSLPQIAYVRRTFAGIGANLAALGQQQQQQQQLNFWNHQERLWDLALRISTSAELSDQYGHHFVERMLGNGEWLVWLKMQHALSTDSVNANASASAGSATWLTLVPLLIRPSPSMVRLLVEKAPLHWALLLIDSFYENEMPAVRAHVAGLIALQRWREERQTDPVSPFAEAWTELQQKQRPLDLELLPQLVGSMSGALDYAERMVEFLEDQQAHEAACQMARVALATLRAERHVQAGGEPQPGLVSVRERTEREITQTQLGFFLFMRALDTNALDEALSVLVKDLRESSAPQTRDALYLLLQKAIEMKGMPWLLAQSLPPLCFLRSAEALWRLATACDLERAGSLYETTCAVYMTRNEWWLAACVAVDWAERTRQALDAVPAAQQAQLLVDASAAGESERVTWLLEQRQCALQLALYLLKQAGDKAVPVTPSWVMVQEADIRRAWLLVRYQRALRRQLNASGHSSGNLRFLFETSDAAARSVAYQLVASPHRFDGESGIMAALRLTCLWWNEATAATAASSDAAAPSMALADVRRETARIIRLAVELLQPLYDEHAAADAALVQIDKELEAALNYAALTARTGYVFTPALEAWIQCTGKPMQTASSERRTNSQGIATERLPNRDLDPAAIPTSTAEARIPSRKQSDDASESKPAPSTFKTKVTVGIASAPRWLVDAVALRENHLESMLKLLIQKQLYADAAQLVVLRLECSSPRRHPIYLSQHVLLQLRELLNAAPGTSAPTS
jgi:hypothetical protein